jgi:hypothetical protein
MGESRRRVEGASGRAVRLALVGGRPAARHGELLQLLQEYRADVTASLVAENDVLRAELERMKRGVP